jgi:hypothetical protein
LADVVDTFILCPVCFVVFVLCDCIDVQYSTLVQYMMVHDLLGGWPRSIRFLEGEKEEA